MTQNAIIDAAQVVEEYDQKRIVSVSPAIDVGLSGKLGVGIPEGSWVLLSGSPKCGKSSTALQIAANAQEQFEKEIFIGNAEGRIKARDLRGIHNLNIDNVKIIQSSKGNILSAEQSIFEYIKIIKEYPGCVLVVDSTSALCEKAEMDEEVKADRRLSGAKLLASFCRQLGAIVPIQNSIVILIQHMIANTILFMRAVATRFNFRQTLN
jgi:RecA/RadA recombinase